MLHTHVNIVKGECFNEGKQPCMYNGDTATCIGCRIHSGNLSLPSKFKTKDKKTSKQSSKRRQQHGKK